MEDKHNKSGFTLFLIILTLNILFFGYISFVHPGVSGVDSVGKQTPEAVTPAGK